MSDYQFNPSIEQWKEIYDFPGYKISDHGRIVSYWYRGRKGSYIQPNIQRFLKPQKDRHGYQKVSLKHNDGKIVIKYIAPLVLEIFNCKCPIGLCCCHNDGNPNNNIFNNLRWDTLSSNQIDRIKHGTDKRGSKHPLAKLSTNDINFIRYLYKHGKLQKEIANLFSVRQQHISEIVNHKVWKHLP